MHKHPRARLGALLFAPGLWLVVAYLGALAALLVTAFFTIDSFTGNVLYRFNLDNFHDMLTDAAYKNVFLRTLGIAVAVTVISPDSTVGVLSCKDLCMAHNA